MKVENETQDQVEIIDEKSIEKQEMFLGSLRPHSGHSCYEYDTETNTVQLAKFEQAEFNMITGEPLKRKIITKESAMYITALNKKNAIKKFSKILNRDISDLVNL